MEKEGKLQGKKKKKKSNARIKENGLAAESQGTTQTQRASEATMRKFFSNATVLLAGRECVTVWPSWLLPASLPSIPLSSSHSLAWLADILECITAPQQLVARCLSSPALRVQG